MTLGGIVSATAQPSTSGSRFTPAILAASGTLASTPIQDCSTGCTNMTCDSHNVCTIWYCSGSGGCVVEGRFVRQIPAPQQSAAGTPSDRPTGSSTVFVKTCQTDTLCNLYALSDRGAVLVGTFDNIKGAAERYGKLKH